MKYYLLRRSIFVVVLSLFTVILSPTVNSVQANTIKRTSQPACLQSSLPPSPAHAIPTQAGRFTLYNIPGSNADGGGITTGPDGNLWFTTFDGNQIGRVTTDGSFTMFTAPTSQSEPYGITSGPDGNLWFTEYNGNQIGRITPSGVITEFPLPSSFPSPQDIITGSDGNLWFTEFNGPKIGRITPTGKVTEFSLPQDHLPQFITRGSDGNLWFTTTAATLGRITLKGHITEFRPGDDPYFITSGPDGNLWYTAYAEYHVTRYTLQGNSTQFPIPRTAISTQQSGYPGGPQGITTGSDGNLWFAEDGNFCFGPVKPEIERLTTTGTFTEFLDPDINDTISSLTSGPDGNVWFNDQSKIGKITTK
jgi:streptogramin lyase